MSADLRSTVVSTFIENDTEIRLQAPSSDADSDIWHRLQIGHTTSRLDIYFPEADLRRLRDAIDQHLAGA